MLSADVALLPHAPRRILDLACGDGYLLALLARKFPKARLIGIDMSPEELAAARERVQSAAELQLAHAAALPLEDAYCDAVTCHLALMLMEDAPSIVRELGRVLVPGGIFAAVLNGRLAVEAAEDPPPLFIGDSRIQSAEDLQELFVEQFRDVRIEEAVLALDGTQTHAGPDAVVPCSFPIRHIVAVRR